MCALQSEPARTRQRPRARVRFRRRRVFPPPRRRSGPATRRDAQEPAPAPGPVQAARAASHRGGEHATKRPRAQRNAQAHRTPRVRRHGRVGDARVFAHAPHRAHRGDRRRPRHRARVGLPIGRDVEQVQRGDARSVGRDAIARERPRRRVVDDGGRRRIGPGLAQLRGAG